MLAQAVPESNTPTTYNIRCADGSLWARHIREDVPGGKKSVKWKRPNGSWGLGGRKLEDAPLYGSEMLKTEDVDIPVIVTEGEKARDALLLAFEGCGIRDVDVVGTVTGASVTP